jgi:hypothetical protein
VASEGKEAEICLILGVLPDLLPSQLVVVFIIRNCPSIFHKTFTEVTETLIKCNLTLDKQE